MYDAGSMYLNTPVVIVLAGRVVIFGVANRFCLNDLVKRVVKLVALCRQCYAMNVGGI